MEDAHWDEMDTNRNDADARACAWRALLMLSLYMAWHAHTQQRPARRIRRFLRQRTRCTRCQQQPLARSLWRGRARRVLRAQQHLHHRILRHLRTHRTQRKASAHRHPAPDCARCTYAHSCLQWCAPRGVGRARVASGAHERARDMRVAGAGGVMQGRPAIRVDRHGWRAALKQHSARLLVTAVRRPVQRRHARLRAAAHARVTSAHWKGEEKEGEENASRIDASQRASSPASTAAPSASAFSIAGTAPK